MGSSAKTSAAARAGAGSGQASGGSRNIDFGSFRVGLGSSHRLTKKLWLSYGGGMTVGNSLNITNTDGSDLYKNTLDDLDEGYYGFVSLSLKAW